jgi:hypothetical protein
MMMQRRFLDHLVRWAVFIAAAAQIVALLTTPLRPKPFGDRWFHEDAALLVAALQGDANWSTVQIRHAPGPVLYYAAAYLLASRVASQPSEQAQYTAGVSLNVLALLASLVLIWRAASLVAGPAAGAAAVYLLALNPLGPYYAWGILAEPPAYLGAALAIYGWARLSSTKHRNLSGGAALAVLGCAGLVACRPNAALLVILIAVVALVPRLWPTDRGYKIRKTTLVVAGLTAVLLALVFQLVKLGRSGSSNQTGTLAWVALHGSFQLRNEPFDWRYWDDKFRVGSADYGAWERTNGSIVNEAKRRGMDAGYLRLRWVAADFLSRPLLRLRMALLRVFYLHVWSAHSSSPANFRLGPLRGSVGFYVTHGILNVSFWIATVLLLVWCWKCRRRLGEQWGVWAPWLSLVIFSSLVYAEPRYLYPSQPGVYVGAALLLDSWLRKNRPAPGPVSTAENGAAG